MFDTIAPRNTCPVSVLPPDMILSKMQPQVCFPGILQGVDKDKNNGNSNDKLAGKRSASHRASERSTASTCSSSSYESSSASSSSSSTSSVESEYQELFHELQQELDQALQEQEEEEYYQQEQQDQDSPVPQFVLPDKALPESALLLDELASEQDVIDLLQTIQKALQDNHIKQRELQEKAEARFDMACGRVHDGCQVSAKMSTRRMHRVRLELGRASALQCRYMEMYSHVYDAWHHAKSIVQPGHTIMVDVDVQHYRDCMSTLEQHVQDLTAIPRTDEEMMQEVQHMCSQQSDL